MCAISAFLSKKLKHWTHFTYPCGGVYVCAISAFLSKKLKHWTLFTYPCGGVYVCAISAFLSKKLRHWTLLTYPCGGAQWLSLAGYRHKVPLCRFCQSVTTFLMITTPETTQSQYSTGKQAPIVKSVSQIATAFNTKLSGVSPK